jgi:hypothetical protein
METVKEEGKKNKREDGIPSHRGRRSVTDDHAGNDDGEGGGDVMIPS